MSGVTISLDFMPAFYHKHLGVRFGEAYYFDPGHREMVEREKGRFLQEILGRYGVGDPTGSWARCIFIQPIDLMMHAQGAEWRFPVDATLESWGAPWAALSIDEIAAIDARETAHHPVIDRLLAQYRELERLHGDAADILGVKSGVMNIHTPYTTAHQLYGEELFVLMMTEPEDARRIFAKVWELYRAILARVADAAGARFTKIYLGDCAASLLSSPLYQEVVLPMNLEIIRQFPAAGYHSCGASSHLLGAFSRLGQLEYIQLGAGTEIAEAARLLPGTILEPLVDPVLMREGTPDDVTAITRRLLHDAAPAPGLILCAWSFDRDTPIENVEAMYDAVG